MLPFDEPSNLSHPDMALRIHQATGGYVGEIMKLIHKACELAIEDGGGGGLAGSRLPDNESAVSLESDIGGPVNARQPLLERLHVGGLKGRAQDMPQSLILRHVREPKLFPVLLPPSSILIAVIDGPDVHCLVFLIGILLRF